MERKGGCLRTGLILVILFTSISIGVWYLLFNSNRFEPPEETAETIVVRNALLWDGQTEKTTQLLIRAGEIICVGNACAPESEVKIVDAKGMAALPGLIDLNVQYYAPSAESRELSAFKQLTEYVRQRPSVRKNFIKAGVTGIRCLGDIPSNIAQLQTQVEEHELAGPKVYPAAALITAPGGFPIQSLYQGNEMMVENAVFQVAEATAMEEAVVGILDKGSSGVKFVFFGDDDKLTRLDRALFVSGVQMALKRGAWVHVYAGTNEEVRQAAQLGVSSIEFGGTEDWDSLTVQELVKNEVVYVPSLRVNQTEIVKNNLRQLYQAGGRIGVGSGFDAQQSLGESTLAEMEAMVEAGLPSPAVLRAATEEGVRCLKVDNVLGGLQKGQGADLILVEGKPWENISDLRQVRYVIRSGRVLMEEGRLVE
jgi:imidazolonepropionase-like amidohydrolase